MVSTRKARLAWSRMPGWEQRGRCVAEQSWQTGQPRGKRKEKQARMMYTFGTLVIVSMAMPFGEMWEAGGGWVK